MVRQEDGRGPRTQGCCSAPHEGSGVGLESKVPSPYREIQPREPTSSQPAAGQPAPFGVFFLVFLNHFFLFHGTRSVLFQFSPFLSASLFFSPFFVPISHSAIPPILTSHTHTHTHPHSASLLHRPVLPLHVPIITHHSPSQTSIALPRHLIPIQSLVLFR